ncbi:MAG: hypothetical protein LAP38_01850 [Acidobacteriia bacterium]|nr:hypothetical protein [Terriglobia bacterium]
MNREFRKLVVLVALGAAPALWAQPAKSDKKPFQAQSASTIGYSVKDGQEVIEITNVSYEIAGSSIPGLPRDERLALRMTTRSKQVIDEIGMEATTTVEAWPLGVDVKQKPLYAVTATGDDPKTVNSDLIVISRGLEETEWWSVYKLGNGAHLFDTYVPLVQFSISREVGELRYVGLEVPEDDVKDARLKAPNVVAVLTYASAERVVREALITCDNPKLAELLRSFADTTRKVALVEQERPAVAGKPVEPARSLSVRFSENYPSAPMPRTISIPIVNGDLDFAHVQAPAGVHVAGWTR